MMPEETRTALQEILSDSRYQPRAQDQGLWSKLWERYGSKIVEEIRHAFQWISDRIPHVPVPDWLKVLGAKLARIIDWIFESSIIDYFVLVVILSAVAVVI